MKKILGFVCLMLLITISSFAQTEPLKVGEKVSNFEAIDYLGQTISLDEALEEGPAVILFYRGGWCRYCNLQLQAYQQKLSEFEELGVSIIAISVDKQEKANETVMGKELGFQVVSDPEAKLLKTYKVVYQVPAELAKKYKEEYNIDLQTASGRDDGLIAVPATYVIDTDYKIMYSYANEDYKTRPQPDEILTLLREKL